MSIFHETARLPYSLPSAAELRRLADEQIAEQARAAQEWVDVHLSPGLRKRAAYFSTSVPMADCDGVKRAAVISLLEGFGFQVKVQQTVGHSSYDSLVVSWRPE